MAIQNIKIKIIFLSLVLLFIPSISSADFKLGKPPYAYKFTSGLVAHWTFDGKNVVDGSFRDITATGAHLTASGISTTTFYAAGKMGQGLNFDGVNDYLERNTSLTLSSYPYTMSAWVKASTGVPNSGIIWIGDKDTDDRYSSISIISEQFALLARFDDPPDILSSSVSVDGGWHHVVAVFTSSSMREIYVDGVSRATDTTSWSYPNIDRVSIGAFRDTTPDGYIVGVIDDVRVYNRVLSASEILELYKFGDNRIDVTSKHILTSGLVGHWTFDGKNFANGVAEDVTENTNNGTLVSISTSTFYKAGRIGQGVSFDGDNDYIDIGNSSTIKPNLPLTISAWVKLNEVGANTFIFMNNFRENFFAGAMMQINSTNNLRCQYGSNASIATAARRTFNTTATLSLGQWYHVVCVIRGATDMTAYINGVDSSGSYDGSGGTMAYSSNSGNIGRGDVSGTGGNNLFSFMDADDIRLYNRALSAAEVSILYNLGK